MTRGRSLSGGGAQAALPATRGVGVISAKPTSGCNRAPSQAKKILAGPGGLKRDLRNHWFSEVFA